MKYKIRLFAFYLATSCSTLIHATTGGPEKIEILGLDKADYKIYFTRNYYDESNRPPTLYYFSLNKKNSNIPIEVKSIYKNIKNNDSDQTIRIENEINKIKRRLITVTELTNTKASIRIIKDYKKSGPFWLNDAEEVITKFTQEYIVINHSFISKTQKSTSYSSPKINILNLHSIPTNDNKYQIAIVQYLGIPTELGYMIEDAILLSPK